MASACRVRSWIIALVETAREAGAEVRERCGLEEVLWTKGRVSGVVVKEADGTRVQIDCKLLVGADGRRSTVARLVGAERPVPRLAQRARLRVLVHGRPAGRHRVARAADPAALGRHPRADLPLPRRPRAVPVHGPGDRHPALPRRTPRACGRRCSRPTRRSRSGWAARPTSPSCARPATTSRSSAAAAARAGRWPATPGTSRTRSSARASATPSGSGGCSARPARRCWTTRRSSTSPPAPSRRAATASATPPTTGATASRATSASAPC